ncbi:GNAT family N-acetyltransferase [Marinifilum caeruleilacunae]|uniref:GNAT family N-acetyltransferase n=1 Tax=Marinifilum caeruleilacunae TaxID=2499076 RepID=A0ABX1WZJ7_9BACT|nr:GNAT family N-acetyltransferase [Marinifilum caeruleilacunae]NOU61386.1 GNAT family N-acetyltransferase [Marinifilum caeruleilacunae]
MDQNLFNILNSNPSRNIAVLGFLNSYPLMEYYIEGKSALILAKSDYNWAHIASFSEEELSILLQKHHNKSKYYYSLEDWMIPLILKHGEEDWRMTTNRFVLDDKEVPDLPKLNIKPIDKSYTEFMYENSDYKEYLSLDYIEDRLSKDISAGIWIEGKLVAWGFTHDDGALGFLHVLEEHRQKGYAIEIMLGLIQMRKNENKAVFGNILPHNHASTNLVKKLGFRLDCRISWLKLK